MNHLIRGDEYLARTPQFKLVGRDKELKRLSAILVRSKANSVLLVGPGGVGCSALCLGLQASKQNPNTPFDIVSKRLFWLDTDALFSQGDGGKINESIDRIVKTLYRTPESVLIIEDMRDLIEAARNNGSTHIINALTLAIKSGKTQAIIEARDEDLDLILKSHSDIRELFTFIDLEEPVGDDLHEIVKDSAVQLHAFHKIRIAPEAVDSAIELTSKYRSRDGGIVGEAVVTGCVTEHPSRYFTGPVGFVLAEAKPLPFVPVRGMQGFFNVPAHLIETEATT